MSETFFGKFFKYQSSENLDAFQDSLGLSADKIGFISFKCDQKIEKQGGSYVYTFVTPVGDKALPFTSGLMIEDNAGGTLIKNTFTVDGNRVTHVVKFDSGLTITAKKNFSATEMTEELTNSNWNGVANLTFTAELL